MARGDDVTSADALSGHGLCDHEFARVRRRGLRATGRVSSRNSVHKPDDLTTQTGRRDRHSQLPHRHDLCSWAWVRVSLIRGEADVGSWHFC